MKKLMVAALGLWFVLGTATAFGQVAQPDKTGKKKSGKRGGSKAPKKDSGKSAL
jgi:hypothetical protein